MVSGGTGETRPSRETCEQPELRAAAARVDQQSAQAQGTAEPARTTKDWVAKAREEDPRKKVLTLAQYQERTRQETLTQAGVAQNRGTQSFTAVVTGQGQQRGASQPSAAAGSSREVAGSVTSFVHLVNGPQLTRPEETRSQAPANSGVDQSLDDPSLSDMMEAEFCHTSTPSLVMVL